MNVHPDVVRHLPGPLSREASNAYADRVAGDLDRRGWGLWAVEVTGQVPFAGYVGLSVPTFAAPFQPAVEVGWRLGRGQWGQGYATEAATAALSHAFGPVGLTEVVSFTVPANTASRRVMDRLGMTHNPADDFDHPVLPVDSPLRRHVLYRVTAEQWNSRA